MITLYKFGPCWGLPDPSPFCFKVENYLRMTGLPYTATAGEMRKAPKGKLPYIVDDDGARIADSAHIIEHLEKKHGNKLDGHLSAEQRATAHVLRRALEEGFYWCFVFARWAEDRGFAYVEADMLRPVLPPLLRSILPGVIRKQVLKQLHAQGTGRHSADQIYGVARADLDALSAFLGDKPFFLGDTPASIDASAYAFLAVTLGDPNESSPMKAHIKSRPNLVAYCDRMKARYYAS